MSKKRKSGIVVVKATAENKLKVIEVLKQMTDDKEKLKELEKKERELLRELRGL